ncbi:MULTISPECIES: DNA adenine methylase [Enterobacteriaceae]|jgi:adenine-specific DNA-methyltransferase|uniref:site-specific DNA-methyltransferase (adenine-specific) n=1 Tax=Klebsiella quasipneumoniae TaxID=1463165 RepID=A0A7D6FSA9_9ENTR|nr:MULTISPECIES: DNA adenine methylase [Enterobacteriaceae]QCC99661.1 DNA methyltransferase [Enterobacter cloacae]QLO02002.1 DNA adenine methylase [Klebsiella quasipneumoniae]RIV03826.1 DNA methyltransferase [Klebsiella pneumoniae]GDC85624.1 modification methylase FokI [Escherichia coli]HBU7325531.1 DNA adenine methylase [Klebsiella pneumoniae]
MSLSFNDLFSNDNFQSGVFPKTRYQGSKYKLTTWIADSLSTLEFDTVLDAFSGTSSVAYMFKAMGKSVIANDKMNFNYQIAKAFIENRSVTINEKDIDFVLKRDPAFSYKTFINDTFEGIYYLKDENLWLDIVTQNIHRVDNEYKRSLLFWALFQSCLSKRPYNLFHRNNLSVRTADVKRSFGNKATWDKPFDVHFLNFIKQANLAVFDNKKTNQAISNDVANLISDDIKSDLVYFDPPYVPQKGSLTMYMDFYHFLEGLTIYDDWGTKIDFHSKNNTMLKVKSPWEDRKLVSKEFFSCIEKFKDRKIAISYREDGIPSIDDIVVFLRSIGKCVDVKHVDYKYALSKKTDVREVLIVGV